jgi:hypothetical protein
VAEQLSRAPGFVASAAPWAAGDRIGALRIAAWFIDRSEATKAFKRGMDAHNNPQFYRQLGKDPELLLRTALQILAQKSLPAGRPEKDVIPGHGAAVQLMHVYPNWALPSRGLFVYAGPLLKI